MPIAIFVRRLRIVTLFLGVGLLITSFGLLIRDGRNEQVVRMSQDLLAEAGTESARLNEYFQRSAALVSQLAQNPSFRDFFENPSAAVIADAQRALAFIETIYPDSLSEACFIDASGAELPRAVRGEIASSHHLSPDETAAPFFKPTMAMQFGEVYQSAPYRSEDTNDWVIAASTLVPFDDGVRRALVHFEIHLDSLRSKEASYETEGRTRIIDTSGLVVVDSRFEQQDASELGQVDQRQFEAVMQRFAATEGPRSQVLEIDSELVAFRDLQTGTTTPNQWYVAVSAPPPGGWFSALSLSSMFVLGGAAIVFGFAISLMFAHERKLRVMATTDALTGLPNRALFVVRATQAISLAKRDNQSAAVLLLDLDRFKEVNDTLGHHRGDQLLCEVATRLNGVVRESDTIARLGGDEFALFLSRVDGLAGAVRAAERIAHALSNDSLIDDIPIQTSASVGIAMFPDHGTTVGDLLQHADVAMYKAKRAGGDFSVYSVDDDPHSTQRLSLSADLRSGIARGELRVHYQPKYDLQTMGIIGVEALVRWEHPRLGLLQPGDFLRSAEAAGLLRVLTNSVMTTAFRQLAAWAAQGWHLTMAVNVAPQTIADAAFLDDLRSAIETSGADPQLIVIEITENSLFAEFVASNRALTAVRGLGCSISIDDFGTGYSSLSYLRELPIDEVKIDRSFVMSLQDETADQAIVQSTIELAHSLGYRVVAEGIETVEALNLLNTMGCESGQGFFLRRPATASEIEDLRTHTVH